MKRVMQGAQTSPTPTGSIILGPQALLAPDVPRLALFCARRAPASILLRAHDLARAWSRAGPVVVGGFQSIVEREVLDVLLGGERPIIVVRALPFPARWRPPHAQRAAWEQGRLLVVAPERGGGWGRAPSLARNRVAAGLAQSVLVAYAEPRGATARLAHEVLERGQPLYTLAGEWNAHLLAAGALPWPGEEA